MATEIKNTTIPNLETDWENYSGKSVQEFLKSQLTKLAEDILGIDANNKVGYFYVDEDGDNSVLYGFRDLDDYSAWADDKEGQAGLVLCKATLPSGSGSLATVSLNMLNEKTFTVTNKNNLKAKLQFYSSEYNIINQSNVDTNEDGTLTISRRMEGDSAWKTVGTISMQSQASSDTTSYKEIDLAEYVVEGTQTLRLSIVGDTTGKRAQNSIDITLTIISLTFGVDWQKAFVYNANSPQISIPVRITGKINKTLHYYVQGMTDSSYTKSYTFEIGTNTYTENKYAAIIDHPKAHGIYKISAYITLKDNPSVKSDTESLEIICSTDDATTPLMAINDSVVRVQNWSNTDVFKYAVYNPVAEAVDVQFTFASTNGGIIYDNKSINSVKNESINTLQLSLEVETDTNENFPMLAKFNSGDNILHPSVNMICDNSESYAPTTGADFYLNPKKRENSEANPASIINYMNGNEVRSSFEGITFGKSDGWITDSNTNTACLRVLEGGKVEIRYDAYSDTTGKDGLSIELDFAARNVTDTEGILFQMGTTNENGKFCGLWVKGQESCFYTNSLYKERDLQNWTYAQDTRTHVVINIINDLYGSGVNYVRVFINGVISREFEYENDDAFWQPINQVKKTGYILINPQGADIDIYGLRIYKKGVNANEIRQNYLSSFSTIEEKKAFKAKNDILDDSDRISYDKAYEKYNTILYKGAIPDKANKEDTYGDVIIHKPGDPAHSGTLHDVKRKGQGSSSKKYMTWNIQCDFKNEEEEQGIMRDQYWERESDGENMGQVYLINDDVPAAAKLVDKRNWASSMQSHKMGATKMANDLYKKVVGKNEVTKKEGYENCRIAVYEEPFLIFNQIDDNSEKTFVGMGTFGSGKADKPTFGFDKKKTPDMMMIEGSDNNPLLTKHHVPWIVEDVIYDKEDESFQYNAVPSWDLDLCSYKDPYACPTMQHFIDAFNFVFANSNRIKPFNGTLEQLKADTSLDFSYAYWVTTESTDVAQFDLFRYETVSKTWVPAGVTKNEDGTYATLNLETQLKDNLPSSYSDDKEFMMWDKCNDDFITARKKVFSNGIFDYFDKSDLLFQMQYVKLLAGTDNRAKNTYMWCYDPDSKIRFFQDDVDTIIATDNQGQMNKPYYVEEHDFDSVRNKDYWNGEDNVLYNMMEECFPTDLINMMQSILAAMTNISGSIEQFWEDYFLSTTDYFPAVAYNEWARVAYEAAQTKYNAGTYENDTKPITQSLGNQREGERQWLTDRAVYMSSYAMYGEFNLNATKGAIQVRSTDKGKNVDITMTPAMWLYPVVVNGQGYALSGQRCQPGQTISTTFVTDSNTLYMINGVDYMSDTGTWYDRPANGDLKVAGKRLKKFIAGSDKASEIRLKPSSVTATNMIALQVFDMHNISTLGGNVTLTDMLRLQRVDLRGTNISNVYLPAQEFLTEVKLPASLLSLTFDGQTALTNEGLTIEGFSYLQSLYINEATTGIDALTLVNQVKDSGCKVSDISIYNIEWTDVTTDFIEWLIDHNAKITGKMTLASGQKVSATLKMKMVGMWGQIDDESNSLYVEYSIVEILLAELAGASYLEKEGTYSLELTTNPSDGNNVIGIEWSLVDNTIEENVIDTKTGIITVNEIGTKENSDGAVVKVVIKLSNGESLESIKQVYYYAQELELGDYLYHDGTVSSDVINSKTVVGVCFMRNPDNHRQGLFIAPTDLSAKRIENDNTTTSWQWGLWSSTDGNSGMAGITLADEPSYSVYDIQTIDNIGSGQWSNTDVYFRDEENGDADGWKIYTDKNGTMSDIGFKEIDPDTYKSLIAYLKPLGLNVGDSISAGQLKTLRIIAHRDKILKDSGVSLPIPEANATETEQENLTTCLKAVYKANSNKSKYGQYYYPAASRCYAYSPIKSIPVAQQSQMDPRLGEHYWHLMSVGELERFTWHILKGNSSSTEWAIFAKPKAEGKFAWPSNTWYWSSSEFSEWYCWIQLPQSGQFNGGNSSNFKCNSHVVRPVLAFTL